MSPGLTSPSRHLATLSAADFEACGLSLLESESLAVSLENVLSCRRFPDPKKRLAILWGEVSQKLLQPEFPWLLHQLLFSSSFAEWDEIKWGPPPAWTPDTVDARATNLGQLMEETGPKLLSGGGFLEPVSSFQDFQAMSADQPEAYWPLVLERMSIHFVRPPTHILLRCPSFTVSTSRRTDQEQSGQGAAAPAPVPNFQYPRAKSSVDSSAGCATGQGGGSSRESAMGCPEETSRPDRRSTEEKDARPGGTWLPGAVLNISDSCLLPSKDGRRSEEGVALVWAEEEEEEEEEGGGDGGLLGSSFMGLPVEVFQRDGITLQGLKLKHLGAAACHVAHALAAQGLGPGCPVALLLPMTAVSTALYLGVLKAGGIVVSIPESFSTAEISARLEISGAKALFTQDVIMRGGKVLPLYSRVISAPSAPRSIVLPATSKSRPSSNPATQLRPQDIPWSEFLALATSRVPDPHSFPSTPLPADATINILFSSGTTGTPKAIPWTACSAIKAAADAFAHHDIRGGTPACAGESHTRSMQSHGPPSVIAWPTSLGWMMGPWLLFAGLVNGGTVALFHGSPLTRRFGEFVRAARVSVLGVVPSIVKSWRMSGCMKGIAWREMRAFSSTGEASGPDDSLWLMSRSFYRAPILEYCGGTEIAGAFLTGSLLQPQSLSSFSTPAMGCSIVILDDQGRPQPDSLPAAGECALMPEMMGASWKLLNADHFAVYFKGMPIHRGKTLRRHGDAIERLPGGMYRAHGRVDDTMNLGGIKVSSVEIERVCNHAHPDVAETAAIGLAPRGGGPEQLVIVAVLKQQQEQQQGQQEKGGGRGEAVMAEDLLAAFSPALQRGLNPLFKVSAVVLLPSLPRTASNKIIRRELRAKLAQLIAAGDGSPGGGGAAIGRQKRPIVSRM